MLDKLVPNVILVFTTLAIMNSIGIVSSQDELRHGIATDCRFKCIKTCIVIIWNVFQMLDKACCFLGYICGDKCMKSIFSKCECGDTTFNGNGDEYCCIQRNETCKIHGM